VSGVADAGNEGVASYVQRTRFAIGYVEYTYAYSHNLSDVSLRNHDGIFVRARTNIRFMGVAQFTTAMATQFGLDTRTEPLRIDSAAYDIITMSYAAL
jgi:hypothetical protein